MFAWKKKPPDLRVVAGGDSAHLLPKLDEVTERALKKDRELIVKFISDMKQMIFGVRQAFGIRVAVNTWFSRTQVELEGAHVASVLFIGYAGSGKTALADALARKFADGGRELYNKIVGLDDIMPSQLFGWRELVKGEDGKWNEEYREGFIVPDRPLLTIDEFPRLGHAAQNGAASILSDGEIAIGSFRKRIARAYELLIAMLSANPPGATGTHTPGQFLVDRVVAAVIFRTDWRDRAYMRMLTSADDHWERVREKGYHLPLLAPKDVMEMYERFRRATATSEAALDSIIQLVQAFLTLTEPRWASSPQFRGKPIPARWKSDRGNMSDAPLIREISDSTLKDPLAREPGGRMCQHFKMLAQADSFFTYGSRTTVVPAIQAMAKAIFTSRVMWGMAEGGQEILYSRYDGDILQFTEDMVDWLVRSVEIKE
ncbi:MAG: hypothetical protein HYT22_00070 [Candidatus Niyogibacteria bacterium]|nr:hypothetical protein [Candidatus Niyogibacteria bacterium]